MPNAVDAGDEWAVFVSLSSSSISNDNFITGDGKIKLNVDDSCDGF